jgi:hypothetical protein
MLNTSDAVIAVISGAFPNTLEKTLEAVRSVSVGRGPIPEDWLPFCPDPSSVTIIGGPEHRAIQNQFPAASWVFVNNRHEAPTITSQILQQRFVGSGKRVLVLAFSGDVFNLTKIAWLGFQVESRHFFEDHRRVAAVSSVPMTFSYDDIEPPWNWGHLSTLQEALATLTQVLSIKKAVAADNPLRQTSLRPQMGRANNKFFGSASSTKSSGMVGTLLQIAAMRGLIELAGDPGDYLIWLKRSEIPLAGMPPRESLGKDVPTDRLSALETASPNSPGGNALSAKQGRITERRIRNPEKYSSDLYSNYIQEARMGPFPTARPVVYDALDKIVTSGANLSLSSLIEAAVEKAKGQLPTQPWPAIRHVTQNQLLKAQAVLDADGKPLPDRWDSGKRIVHRLADDWQVRASGEILIALFEATAITGQELVNVCRSVWGSSGGDALDELYRVMEYLTDVACIVQEDNSGFFRVKRQQVQTITSLPIASRIERIASESETGTAIDEPKDLIQ